MRARESGFDHPSRSNGPGYARALSPNSGLTLRPHPLLCPLLRPLLRPTTPAWACLPRISLAVTPPHFSRVQCVRGPPAVYCQKNHCGPLRTPGTCHSLHRALQTPLVNAANASPRHVQKSLSRVIQVSLGHVLYKAAQGYLASDSRAP